MTLQHGRQKQPYLCSCWSLRPEIFTVTSHAIGAPTLKFLRPYLAKICTPDRPDCIFTVLVRVVLTWMKIAPMFKIHVRILGRVLCSIYNPWSTAFPNTYSTAGSCAYTVNYAQSDICQLRLDFAMFDITDVSTTGVCTDSFEVTGPTGRNPSVICGTNTGLHSKYSAYLSKRTF